MVLGNLLSHTDMQRAVRGVDYMYFSFAVQNGLLEASTIAAVVAAEAGALRMPPRAPHSFWPCQELCSAFRLTHPLTALQDAPVLYFRISFLLSTHESCANAPIGASPDRELQLVQSYSLVVLSQSWA